MFMNYNTIRIFVFIMLVVSLCSLGTGQDIQTRSFPIPMAVDDDRVLSSMHIKIKCKSYDLSFADFCDKKLDGAEILFIALVHALRERNVTEVQSLICPNAKSELKIAEGLIEGYGEIIKDSVVGEHYEKITLLNQFYAGKDRIFTWNVDTVPWTDKGPFFTYYRMQEPENEPNVCWNHETDNLTSLLCETVEKNLLLRIADKNKKEKEFDYEIPVPRTTEGHIAYLQFNGKQYNFDIFQGQGQVDPNDEILEFYQKSWEIFRNEPPEVYANLYTARSRNKYMKRVRNYLQEKTKYEKFIKHKVDGKPRVRFVINANPLYIIFVSLVYNDKEYIFTNYIARTNEGKLKLTNYHYKTIWDNFMDDPILFKDTILKSLLASPSYSGNNQTKTEGNAMPISSGKVNSKNNESQTEEIQLEVVSTDPEAPAILGLEQKLYVYIYYYLGPFDHVQVWARPYYKGRLVSGYLAHRIITLSKQEKEDETAIGWFYFKEPAQIDEIRVVMRDAKTKEIIKTTSYKINARWMDRKL